MNRRLFLATLAGSMMGNCVASERQLFSEKYDLIVVGGGGAGLASAATAAELGARVLLLEKLGAVGGNTLLSGGYFGVVDPVRQKPLGIEDSVERHFNDVYLNGDMKADKELVWQLVSNAPSTLHWLEGLGMEFQDRVIEIYGSHFPRCHLPFLSAGKGYIQTLSNAALKYGVQIRTSCPVFDLLQSDDGRIIGVLYRQNGRSVAVSSEKGVVIASGGFGSNVSMVSKYRHEFSGLTTDNGPGATGEMLVVAETHGANLIGMENIQCLPGTHPDGKIRVRFHSDLSRFIMVDRHGRRFTEEGGRRDALTQSVLNLEGRYCYVIIDNDGFNSYSLTDRREAIRAIETGDAFKAYSLEELAAKIRVDESELRRSLYRYNQDLADHPNKKRYPIKNPPFWASRSAMTIHSTIGGIQIDKSARCLKMDGSVLSGLYAAGECTGGVHGNNRIGANGICDALTFGRIAARAALGVSS